MGLRCRRSGGDAGDIGETEAAETSGERRIEGEDATIGRLVGRRRTQVDGQTHSLASLVPGPLP